MINKLVLEISPCDFLLDNEAENQARLSNRIKAPIVSGLSKKRVV